MSFAIKNRLGLIPLFVVLAVCFSRAQPAYAPTGATDAQLATLRPVFENLFEKTAASLPGRYKKEYRELYTGLRDQRLEEAESGYYLLDTALEAYLAGMLREIERANPGALARDVRLLLTRDPAPNATTYPDGVILFNAGMLAACPNESQAAFILCHELAHHALQHGPNAIATRFEALYSREAKREMAAIARQENARQKAQAYLSEFTYEHRRHGREHEAEADSLAALLLARTGYDATQAVKALELLDTIDRDYFTPRFDLKNVFNFPGYPFKAKWLEEETTLFQDGARVFDGALNKDSLKTHPDCQIRAQRMAELYLNEYSPAGKRADPPGSDLFPRMRQKARYEALVGAFDGGNIDLCLFHTLTQLQEQPADVFLNALAGRCLNALYAAQRDHVFSRYVQAPRIGTEPGYKRWLQFLNTLRLRELAALAYHFLNTREPAFRQDEEFLYQLLSAATNLDLPAEAAQLKADYLRRFPKGKYRAALEQR